MTQTLLLLALAVGLGWPLGLYLAHVMRGAPSRLDRVFGPVERVLYLALGVRPGSGMDWGAYALAFLLSNAALGGFVWVMLLAQGALPFNPDQVPGMRWDVALHTMVSFLTNTNQQHYSGQAQLSYLSQAVAIVGLQIITPMMGLALVVATLRALFGGRNADAVMAAANAADSAVAPEARATRVPVDVGNFWVDTTRATLRFMLPLCLLLSLALTWQGVPSTFAAGPTITPIDASAGMAAQKIPVGPVAPMVAVKQLGTNGGGWYGPNSAVPLENPTPLSNFLQMLAIVLIPIAVVFMAGPLVGRRRLSAMIFGAMLLLSSVSTAAALWSEAHSATAASTALMEGKEVRFGAETSALWAAVTTQTSNGSVNAMHDSLAPLTGLVTLGNMLVNAIWGGIGCGLQQFLVYLMLAVFLAGLMTGRTPELFGRKIEAPEVKLLALLVLLQPLVVLGFTAVTLAIPAVTGTSNPGFHGISQVFYEYTSAFANNGSGFEGLGDGTPWWNLSCTAVLLLGRYPALVIPLAVAALLARKRPAPVGKGTLHAETATVGLTVVAVIVVLTLLQFMPALVLGPVAEHLSLAAPQGTL